MLCDSLGFIVPSLKEREQPSDVESGSSKTVRAGDRADNEASKQASTAQVGKSRIPTGQLYVTNEPLSTDLLFKIFRLYFQTLLSRLAHKSCAIILQNIYKVLDLGIWIPIELAPVKRRPGKN